MADPSWSQTELEAAVERLSDPERFRAAEEVVKAAAPALPAVLAGALGSGGWFGESHQAETLKVATMPDEEARLTAIRSLLSEETQMGMMVGVAVGWALHRELTGAGGEPEHGGEPAGEEN